MERMYENERVKLEMKLQGMQTTLDSRDEYINGLEEKVKTLEQLVNILLFINHL